MVTTSLHRAGRTCRIAFLIFTGVALLSACSDGNNSDELFPVGPPVVAEPPVQPPIACSDQPIGQPSSECEDVLRVENLTQDSYGLNWIKFEARKPEGRGIGPTG